jgi:hypothetical protein
MADGRQLCMPSGERRVRESGGAWRGWAPAGLVALLASASGVVLLYHGGRDAPALTDRQAVLFRPGPDITRGAGGRVSRWW